jgi:hypothetical protein
VSRKRAWWHLPAFALAGAWALFLVFVPRTRLVGIGTVLYLGGALLALVISGYVRDHHGPPTPRVTVLTRGALSEPAFLFAVPTQVQRLQVLAVVNFATATCLVVWSFGTLDLGGAVAEVIRVVAFYGAAVLVWVAVVHLAGLRFEWAVALTPSRVVATAGERTSVAWDDIRGAVVVRKRTRAIVRVKAPVGQIRRGTRSTRQRNFGPSYIAFPGHLLSGDPEFVRWAIEHYAAHPEQRAQNGAEWERARLLAEFRRR